MSARRRSYHRRSGIGRQGQAGPHRGDEGGREGAVSRPCASCFPSCRRPPRRVEATSSPCCAASASAATSPPPPFATAAAPSWPRPRRPRRRSSRPICRPSSPTTSCARSSPPRSPRPGRSSPKDMGQVMKASMAHIAGRADGKRVSAGSGGAAQLMRRQLELSNEVAAALSGSDDADPARARGPRRMRALPARQRHHPRRRGRRGAAAPRSSRELPTSSSRATRSPKGPSPR